MKVVSCLLALLAASLCNTVALAAGPIAIADIKRDTPVNFEKEILPVLAKNCTACHNAQKAESGLVLETPQTILKGGDSGPAVIPKQPGESLLLKVASHQDEPLMPPADNKVDAVALTSEQLGLIKKWIDEGATGTVSRSANITWQPLPAGMNPIYAVALTPDGQYAACSRANQIFVYHLASGQLVSRLSDPELTRAGAGRPGLAHLDLVQSLAFAPAGDLLASGSFRDVKLWRRPSNVHRLDLTGGTGPVNALAISPDGKLAATGEASGSIKLWDLTTGKDPKTLAGHTAAVSGLQFLPGGARLISASQDKTLRVWNVADGAAVCQVETPAPINALALLADGAQAATGGADNIIRVWTLPAATAADAPVAGAQLAGNAQPITALAVNPTDKTQLISASADGSIRWWNITNNQQVREIKHGAAVTALAVRPDGKQLASAGADNLIKLWNAADGQPWAAPDKQALAVMKGDFRAQFRQARAERAANAITAKVADDKKAAADAEAKIISTAATVTSTQTAKEAATKALAEKNAAVKAPTDAKAAADKELADAGEAAKAATAKATETKAAADKDANNADLAKARDEAKKVADEADKKVKELEKKVADAGTALTKAQQEATTADAANMAADQAAAAAVASVKKAVHDVPLAEQVLKDSQAALAVAQAEVEAAKQASTGSEKPVRTLVYSADGTQLTSGGDNNLVRTWSSDTGAPIESFETKAPVLSLALAADGAILSGAADNSLVLWNPTPEWTLERTIGNVNDPAALVDRVTALAFSPDGKQLATGGGEPSRSGELKIWNVADGSLARALPDAHSDTIFGLEYSPDGKYLASSGADRFVKVFNAATGAHVKSFEGHTHHVLDVSWKWDGKVLASCGADNVIKFWDFITGDQIRTTAAFGKEITSLGFAGPAARIFVGSGDKTVRALNSDNGAVERTFAGTGDFVYSTATSADGRIGIAGGQESTLFVWLVENAQLLKSLPAPKPAEAQPAQSAGK